MSSQKTAAVWGLALLLVTTSNAKADQLIQDDLVVVGSTCIGVDCSSGETFSFDTIRLKENNLRIKFQDTSNAGGFPTIDWQLTANDSANGGTNYFAIENIDDETIPFKVVHGAKTNSLYVHSNGYVGLGTAVPGLQLQITNGNSPGIRLEQDGTSGFAAQTWDVSGNETNFFVRDVTNGGLLPFRIQPGAPNGSLFVASDGDVGIGSLTPDGQFDVAHASNINNHAFLIDPSSNVGINIDNSFVPRGLLDVQTTGGVSELIVESDGDVGIGMGTTDTASAPLHVKRNGQSNGILIEDTGGSDPLLTAKNNGAPIIRLTNNIVSAGSGQSWQLYLNNNGAFRIQNVDNPSAVFQLNNDGTMFMGSKFSVDSNGNTTIDGNLTVNGTCTGC
ncbi:hypothetical protein OLMES_1172 [Oleiphilus messinensis]|uniref:Uncharacterized protein n=1 Tax=Oleiphilus messinensis TaxID=141451 RepID=A0A1Y0I639_9GAMM|nr:hypothetical protein [Oleiphilus messinensis]ARU55256.1 hypothetical protein OLMES_1172 [Oleiphilus messinensis]